MLRKRCHTRPVTSPRHPAQVPGASRSAIAVAVLLTLTSCAGHPATRATTNSAAGLPLNLLSAKDIEAEIGKAGLPTPNAHDVTKTKCDKLDCVGAIDSDTVSILKFAQSGPAERYAGDIRDSFIVEDIVLVFAPTVTPADRTAYEGVVERAARH